MKCIRLLILLLIIISLTACGSKKDDIDLTTPEKSIETALMSLKDMDLKIFNECTDNYVATYTNWIGIPVEREYRIFNELLQPRSQRGKRYQSNKALAQKIVENLSWEIACVQEEGDSAEAELSVTNKDMTDAMGNYTIEILENMVESDGIGIGQLAGNLWDLGIDKSGIIAGIDATDKMITTKVTVQLSKEDNGNWIVILSDEFIDAFMGEISSDYSEDIEKRLKSLEDEYEEKMNQWAEEFENKVEMWFE